MSETDLTALAASLSDTAEHLAEHIERRAAEIAEPQILAARTSANIKTNRLREDHESENQRSSDLVRELRRQLDAQVKQNERLGREVKETRAAIRRVEALHIWTNEDGRKFVFAEELWAALAEVSSYGPAALLAASPKAATDA